MTNPKEKPQPMDTSRLDTLAYWEERVVPHFFMSKEWKASFDKFYADAGPRPQKNAYLFGVDLTRPIGADNFRWANKRGGELGAPKAAKKVGPEPKLTEGEVREILDLGHAQAISATSIATLYPQVTLRDVRDLLAGRRYLLKGYDYRARLRALTAEQRVPAAIARDIREMHARGVSPETMAAKWQLPLERVCKVVGRLMSA